MCCVCFHSVSILNYWLINRLSANVGQPGYRYWSNPVLVVPRFRKVQLKLLLVISLHWKWKVEWNTLHCGMQSVQLYTAHYDKKLCTVHILNTTETISKNSNVIIYKDLMHHLVFTVIHSSFQILKLLHIYLRDIKKCTIYAMFIAFCM